MLEQVPLLRTQQAGLVRRPESPRHGNGHSSRTSPSPGVTQPLLQVQAGRAADAGGADPPKLQASTGEASQSFL